MENLESKGSSNLFSGKGQALWERAKQIIPGGNMLLSKRAEMHLPNFWPAYYSRALGCKVWDLDGNQFFDCSLMGVGTNVLGYGNPAVDKAAREAIEKGNLSTLNCPEEYLLAENLILMNPWAGKVKLARTGGEANAIAVRIARAASGRDAVAVCGYHGWHDWYLSANLADDEALDGHLLTGLEPNGVPKNLRHTVFPFEYNRFDQLREIVDNWEVGVIKMEVSRGTQPNDGFLEAVRTLATERGIVLIFDECTSGFRSSYGGLFQTYDVEPDIAVFGKTLGNGYAITAVVGRDEVMDAAQSTFISSTFWTERIGPAAAIASLRTMRETQSWEVVSSIGKNVKERWRALAASYSQEILIGGLDALATFNFCAENEHQIKKTFLTQEMLRRGFLASNSFYASTAHTREVLEGYFEALEEVFALMSQFDLYQLEEQLLGPVAHSGFRRLN